MGLSLSVGILAELKQHDEEGYERVRDELAAIAGRLAALGLAPHVEPDDLPPEAIGGWDMIGYSALHHLRRVAAHAVVTGRLPDPAEDPTTDPVLREYEARAARRPGLWSRLRGRASVAPSFEHLLVHSDAEGYYVPQDFERVVVLEDNLGAGYVGSSPRLLAECGRLAALLEIPADLDLEGDLMQAALDGGGPAPWQRHAKATHACASLLRAAAASIQHGAVIAFG